MRDCGSHGTSILLGTTTEVVTSLAYEFKRLDTQLIEQKSARMYELRNIVEQVVGLVKKRPIESVDLNNPHLSVQLFQQGIGIEDIASRGAREKMVEIFVEHRIQPSMWVANGENLAMEGTLGLTKSIIEYEYLLGGFLEGLQRGKSQDKSIRMTAADIAASALDRMIVKHQVYLNLSPDMIAALDNNFTLVSFGHDGIIPPIGFPEKDLVGSQVAVRIGDSKGYYNPSVREFYADLQQKLEQFQNASQKIAKKEAVDQSKLPELYQDTSYPPTAEMIQEEIETTKKSLALAPPREGFYTGTILSKNNRGFNLQTSDGQVYEMNVSNGIRFNGIAIRR